MWLGLFISGRMGVDCRENMFVFRERALSGLVGLESATATLTAHLMDYHRKPQSKLIIKNKFFLYKKKIPFSNKITMYF